MEIVTIKYYDETHIKIECDLSTAMEISDYFTFDVPGAKFSPAYKNRVWDGKIRLFNPMACLLYAGLKDQLITFCNSRQYAVEFDGPFGDTEFSLYEANQFIEKLQIKYPPREYQLEAFMHAVRKRRGVLLSPTGSGKSLIIYMLSCFYRSKTLIIVPTTSLVHQMASDFEDYGLPKGMIHKIMSGQEKDPMYYTFTVENGNKYRFESNEYIKMINSNVRQKFAKDIAEDDDIDDRWLQQQIDKQVF